MMMLPQMRLLAPAASVSTAASVATTTTTFARSSSSSSSASGLPSPAVPQTQGMTPYSYVPPGRNHLFVPGPCNLPARVSQALMHASENHRDLGFPYFATQLLHDMKYLFKTEAGRVLMFPGTGTGGWESCLTNTLSPGDKVVCFRYGVFSNLWIDMAQRLGLNVIVLDEEWGNGADEERLRQVLADDVN